MAMQKRLLWLFGIPGFLFIFAGASSGVYLLLDFNVTRVFSIPFALLTFGSFIIGMFLIMTALILFGISTSGGARD